MHRSYRRVCSSSRAHMALERALNESSQIRTPEESAHELDVPDRCKVSDRASISDDPFPLWIVGVDETTGSVRDRSFTSRG